MIARPTKNVKVRVGFTLLEVLLASAIGVMLLAGLYVAVDVQLRQMHAGRRAGEQSSLARGVLSRMSVDISGELAPMLSTVVTNSGTTNGSSSGATTTGGTSAAATPATPSAPTSAASGGSSGGVGGSTASSGSTTTAGNVVVFNTGIQGDTQNLIITSNRVPRENLTADILNNGDQVIGTSDLRRVMYWLAGGGDAGLARYEMKVATSADEQAYCTLPPAVPDEMSYIIAEEIKSIQFSYFDGTNWNDTWDSTQPSQLANSDGVTAQGPPVAIAIVIGVQTDDPDQQQSTTSSLGGGNGLKMYRRVIAIPTANGATITAAGATTGQ